MSHNSAIPLWFRNLKTGAKWNLIVMQVFCFAQTIISFTLVCLCRNPSLKQQLFSYAILGFALSEAMGLFCLMVAFLILFAM